jgi:IS6 family transposase
MSVGRVDSGTLSQCNYDWNIPFGGFMQRTPYMNNIVEQDHRFMKRKINPGLGFGSYLTAWRTIQGYETMHMIRKGQIEGVEKGNIQGQNEFIAGLFGLAA